jgi:hypothetical protein
VFTASKGAGVRGPGKPGKLGWFTFWRGKPPGPGFPFSFRDPPFSLLKNFLGKKSPPKLLRTPGKDQSPGPWGDGTKLKNRKSFPILMTIDITEHHVVRVWSMASPYLEPLINGA